MGSKKQRNPEKRERKKVEKTQKITMTDEQGIALLREGEDYFQKGEYDKVISILEQIPNGNKVYYKAKLPLGFAYHEKGRFLDTLRCWEQVPQTSDQYHFYQFYLGLEHIQLNNYTKAISILENIPVTFSLYSETLINLGAAYAHHGNNEQAVECWDKILPGDEKYFTAQYSIGILFFRKKNYEKARYYWLKIPLTDSNYYNAQYFSGRSYDEEDLFNEAIQCYLKVDINNSLYDEAQYYLGWSYGSIQNYPKALEYFKKVREDHIMYKDAQSRIGDAYFSMQMLKDGLDSYIYWLQLCQETNDNTNREAIGVFNLFYECFFEIPHLGQFPKELSEIRKLIHTYFLDVFNIEAKKNAIVLKELKDNNTNASLYSYSRYDINSIHNIKNENIYFSDPFNFNDPFDPLIRVMDPIKSKNMKQMLNYRISCLSSKWHDILMWSHYANKHQGICIEYDIDYLIKQNNIIFRKIDYIEKLPKPSDGIYFEPSFLTVGEKPTGFDDRRYEDEISLIDTFTRKQKTWEYENEYRLLLRSNNEKDFLQHCPIKAIYFGKDMEQKNKDFIASMVEDMNKEKEEDKIKLYDVSPSDKDIFSLERKEYT